MKVVLSLIKNSFMLLFSKIVILEILVLLTLTFFYEYEDPLQKSNIKVTNQSEINNGDILNQVNVIFQQNFNSILYDLLFVAKHIHSMYLSQNNRNSYYPHIIKESKLYQNYKNCLVSQDKLKAIYDEFVVKNYTSRAEKFNLLDMYSNKIYGQYLLYNEDQIIELILKDPNFDILTFFPSDINPSDFNGLDYEKYLCYALSAIKSIVIRDIIYEKQQKRITSFYIIMREKYIFKFPPDFMTFPDIQKQATYNMTRGICNTTFSINCFDIIEKYSKFDSNFFSNGFLTNRISILNKEICKF